MLRDFRDDDKRRSTLLTFFLGITIDEKRQQAPRNSTPPFSLVFVVVFCHFQRTDGDS